MKSFLFRAGSALLGGLALISMGCQEDNEAAIKEQESKSSGAQVKSAVAQPKNQEKSARAVPNPEASPKDMGYPGAKRVISDAHGIVSG